MEQRFQPITCVWPVLVLLSTCSFVASWYFSTCFWVWKKFFFCLHSITQYRRLLDGDLSLYFSIFSLSSPFVVFLCHFLPWCFPLSSLLLSVFFQVSLSVVFSSVSLLPKRSRRRRSPPTTRSLSLRVRSGAASRCSYTRSLFLPAVQSRKPTEGCHFDLY